MVKMYNLLTEFSLLPNLLNRIIGEHMSAVCTCVMPTKNILQCCRPVLVFTTSKLMISTFSKRVALSAFHPPYVVQIR